MEHPEGDDDADRVGVWAALEVAVKVDSHATHEAAAGAARAGPVEEDAASQASREAKAASGASCLAYRERKADPRALQSPVAAEAKAVETKQVQVGTCIPY